MIPSHCRHFPPNMETPPTTRDSTKGLQGNLLAKSVLTFLFHQFIGMYGIPFTAPLVFSLVFKFLALLGRSYSNRAFYSIVSERPYFPVQITFAVVLGWLLGRALRHRSMVWVWVLPFLILCYSVARTTVLIPTSVLARPESIQSRISHYFGSGCQPADRCLDQLLITMPFYASAAYSIGAALARKTLGYASLKSKKHFQAIMFVGFVVLAASMIDLAISIQRNGWHNMYLLLLLTPTGLGAFLLYIGSAIRRRPMSSA